VSVEWGRIEIEGVGEVKDAELFPGGGRAWDWAETGTCLGRRGQGDGHAATIAQPLENGAPM
jgi:hypothetical protein